MNISRNNSPACIPHATVGIIGGGVAGATIVLRLAELGISINLFEEGKSLGQWSSYLVIYVLGVTFTERSLNINVF